MRIIDSTGTAQSDQIRHLVTTWLLSWHTGDIRVHFLKTVQPFYRRIVHGCKRAEIRLNDRDFKVGDYICCEEYPYNGATQLFKITDVLLASEYPAGLQPGYAMLSVKPCHNWALWYERGTPQNPQGVA